jgi:hypothetical protein
MNFFLEEKSAKPEMNSLRLNFWGKVSVHPSDKSIPICQAFNHVFYVGPFINNMLSPMNPVACPAWHVLAVSPAAGRSQVFPVEVH